MDMDAALRLSFYRDIAVVNEAHGVALVQHVETKAIYVKKTLHVYDLRVFQYLMAHPVPGIPKIEALVEGDGCLYVIEEYISGPSLRERLDASGPLPADEALGHLEQLCDILRPLHSLSSPIVHRDIKPSNLILSPAGRLYLVDFNAAKETSDRKSRDTVLIGTAGYAAPEQYGFSSSQPTADIYALGVLLNEMLTGKMPQEERSDGPLAAVIQKCLQMDPSHRYPTVDLLLQDIKRQKRLPHTSISKVRTWFLPGFRSNSPLRWGLAIVWYAFVLFLSCTAEEKDAGPTELLLFRLTIFLLFFTETLWIGNYRDAWQCVPLSRHPKVGIRLLGITVWAVILFFAVMVLMILLTELFCTG